MFSLLTFLSVDQGVFQHRFGSPLRQVLQLSTLFTTHLKRKAPKGQQFNKRKRGFLRKSSKPVSTFVMHQKPLFFSDKTQKSTFQELFYVQEIQQQWQCEPCPGAVPEPLP